MDRITNRDLQGVVNRLNRMTGNPLEPWTRDDAGKLRANIGNFHISGAYGGVQLHQMMSDGGGVRTVLSTGYCSKRELYHAIHNFLDGLDYAETAKETTP